jgi:hypothetical protein
MACMLFNKIPVLNSNFILFSAISANVSIATVRLWITDHNDS